MVNELLAGGPEDNEIARSGDVRRNGTTQRNKVVKASANPATVAIESSVKSMRGLAAGRF